MPDVFVSYSRRDSDYVLGMVTELTQRGKEVFLDTEGLADAEIFPQALRLAIEGADGFVLVITPDSTSSRYCEMEVSHATELGKRIVPVLLRPVPDETALPPEIRERNWIPAEAHDAAERVVAALNTDLDHVRAHTRWTARAAEWERSGKDQSLLPRGSELRIGEEWMTGSGSVADPAPTVLQRELLAAGRRAVSTRQRRLLAVAGAAVVVSLGLLVFALVARRDALAQRRTADRRRIAADATALAAQSDAALDASPLAALHLARSAVRVQVNTETLRALKQANDSQALVAAPARAPSRGPEPPKRLSPRIDHTAASWRSGPKTELYVLWTLAMATPFVPCSSEATQQPSPFDRTATSWQFSPATIYA